MMNHAYKRWNKKEIKLFYKILEKQFGFKGKIDYILFQKKEKIYIMSKDYDKIKIQKLNSLGLYIAKVEPFGIRLSIEGSQLLGPSCVKNIVQLFSPKEWMQGKVIDAKEEYGKVVLVKYKDEFLGSGLYKNHTILNFIPKSRRTKQDAQKI